MLVLIAREPAPDAPYWPGRGLLAAIDAVMWPLLWIWLIRSASQPVGVIGPFVTALVVLCALNRLHRAIWLNHRYRFTTWRWGRIFAGLMLIGMVMKLVMPGAT